MEWACGGRAGQTCKEAVVQCHRANQLEVVMSKLDGAPCRLAHDGEYFLEQLILRRSCRKPAAELFSFCSERLVIQELYLVLQLVDAVNTLRVGLHARGVLIAVEECATCVAKLLRSSSMRHASVGWLTC